MKQLPVGATPRRSIRLEEQGGNKPQEAIPYFRGGTRLLPGRFTTGVFQEFAGERRIPFSNAKITIIPGTQPAPSIFLLGRPQGSGSADDMSGHRLSILNLTKRSHLLKAREGIHFGDVGQPAVMSMETGTSRSIFVDGDRDGTDISIGPFGNVELLAANGGRWVVTGGRHFELKAGTK